MDATVVACPQCGAKNRIPSDKSGLTAKCGRCHAPLPTATAKTVERITVRCGQCRTKNRLPADKVGGGAKCGRCGAPIVLPELLSGRTVMVTDGNFAQTVLQAPQPVLLYAWSPECSVCNGTGPMVEQLARETRGKARIAKININANPALANQFNILSVPAFLIFDAGQLKVHLPGAVPKHELLLKLARYT